MQFAVRLPFTQSPGVDVTTMWNIFWGEEGEVGDGALRRKSCRSAPALCLIGTYLSLGMVERFIVPPLLSDGLTGVCLNLEWFFHLKHQPPP